MDVPTDSTINVGNVDDEFTLQIRVQDITTRDPTNMGVIALPLNISWDRDAIEFIGTSDDFMVGSDPNARFADPITPRDPNDPADDPNSDMRLNQIVTSAFPLQRSLQSIDPVERIVGLRGASLPNAGSGTAIGSQNEDPFSSLRFRALTETTTPFTIEIAGSMSFTDASVLEPVVRGSNTTATGAITVETNLVIGSGTPPAGLSLSGFVFADTFGDGKFDAGGEFGAREEGLPNVLVQLFTRENKSNPLHQVRTGPDGWYHFEGLGEGTYEIMEVQPEGFVQSLNSLGMICDSQACVPDDDPDDSVGDRFLNIRLDPGQHGVDYNFGDNIIANKRRFVASIDPFRETCSVLQLNCVTVDGTDGDDQITFAPGSDVVTVTITPPNDQPLQEFQFPRDETDIVRIDAGEGEDTVTLIGSSEIDTAHLTANACSLRTSGENEDGTERDTYRPRDYAVLAVNAEMAIADGRLGDDRVVFEDSLFDDMLTAQQDPIMGPITELQWELSLKRLARAIAFEQIRAVSSHGGTDEANPDAVPVDLVGPWLISNQL